MPRVIVQNRIPRVKIGNRPIAVAPADQGGGGVLGRMFRFGALYNGPTTVDFLIPATGNWKFIAHGQGETYDESFGAVGGKGGAYAERTRFLAAGKVVRVLVGYGANATVITWPDGTTMRAGIYTDVSGGDLMFNGGLGGTTFLTPGAPGGGPGGGAGGFPFGSYAGGGGGAGTLQSPGAQGATGTTPGYQTTPGGGAAGGYAVVLGTPNVAVGACPGSGLVVAYLVS